MSKGITHARATLALAAAGGFFTYTLGHPLVQVLALAGGTISGVLLTPDLDIEQGCISNEIVRRILGRRAEQVWSLFWRPYGMMLPHRSRLSHLPLLGTAVRLAYLSILPVLYWWIANLAMASVLTNHGVTAGSFLTGLLEAASLIQVSLPAWVPWAVGGLVLADTLHYLMDRFF